MTDFELDDLGYDELFALESICLNCGHLGSMDACQCCGGPLCHMCHECSCGFCDECSNSPDFNERMLARMSELYEPKPGDIPF